MDTVSRWSSKAQKYAKYRWDYAPQAIQAILDSAHISRESSVADIGAGTGILSSHFLDKAKFVFAVEPNPQMRQQAVKALQQYPSFRSVDGRCDATTLPDQSVDLITVGEALHWFMPQSTRDEFLRILRPGGWLAILRNRGTDKELNKAMQELNTEKNGWNANLSAIRPSSKPTSFWYNSEDFLHLTFPQICRESCEEFIGALSSNSSAPDEGDPLYANFETSARKIFDEYSADGQINISFSTELFLGPIGSV